MIGGQSNASGRGSLVGAEAADASVFMLGNDYRFKVAYEPTDDAANQADAVSDDGANAKHSFALRAAKGLLTAVGSVMLVPCAKGSSYIADWQPAANRVDRSTLYGSANYRRILCGGVSVLWWYGHEADSLAPDNYVADWTTLISEWRSDEPDVPVVYAQLAKRSSAAATTRQNVVAEYQRRTETASGDGAAISRHHMVVTFDLALVDDVHLDASAYRALGDRFALATREHVLGEAVNGTGPRLVSVTMPTTSTVKVKTTRALAVIAGNADEQFRVFDDAVEATVSSVERDPGDVTAALITLNAATTGTVTVSYGDVVASGTGVTLANVVKDADGLPLPQFGLQVAL